MLHTIIAQEFIWGGETAARPECVRICQGYLEGVREGEALVVSRLIATDPSLYLDPRYAPGARWRGPEGAEEKQQDPVGRYS
ncbi:MAG: YlzJ-like family protein [Oscillospiraceae bacterium]|nr:YlzJ-like family protein [Oscillospiraceae bacterium]